jgi:hypothetical protein
LEVWVGILQPLSNVAYFHDVGAVAPVLIEVGL